MLANHARALFRVDCWSISRAHTHCIEVESVSINSFDVQHTSTALTTTKYPEPVEDFVRLQPTCMQPHVIRAFRQTETCMFVNLIQL